MSWKDYMCRTPVIVACYVIGVIFLLIKPLLFGNSDRRSESAEKGASMRSIFRSSRQNGFLNATDPEIPARDAVWQDVDGSTYVYSAYYDDRLRWPKTIRIIGATKRSKSEIFRCKFWYSNREFSATSKARVQRFKGQNKFKYSSCFILCPFMSEEIPDSVSVITHQKRLKNHLLVFNKKKYDNSTLLDRSKPIRERMRNGTKGSSNKTIQTKERAGTIGICVKPLYNNYSDSVQLVEFMELNRLLGVGHVIFYKSSISITTDCVLKNYIDERRATLVTAMPWKRNPRAGIRDANQLAALNDCMYRNMHNFSYLAFLDTDEFIMPAQNDTIQQLIETLDVHADEMPYDIGSYTFHNGFFYMEWTDDANTTKSRDEYAKSLTTLLKTTRRDYLHPHGTRSKFIVKPTSVLEVGRQWVLEFAQGFGRLAVLEDEGILNHYRACEYGGSKCTGEASHADRTVFRYKDRLCAAVKHRWKKLEKQCGVEEIQKAKLTRFKN